ncbi:(2Fe-2S)-binding protein, partial [bacterium]|nr:(2Fe-2S)-binding protein [bacterium]
MGDTVSLKINDISITVPTGTSIKDAASRLDFSIPTLCFHEDLCVAGNCRICVVEQKDRRALLAACATPAEDGMDIHTNSLKVRQARKHIVELLYSEHAGDCATCYRGGNCELQDLAHEYIFDTPSFLDISRDRPIDRLSPAIVKDDGKCIRCQRCVRTCAEIQSVGALTAAHKGRHMGIETFFDKPLHYTGCTLCGQCVVHCPTGALVERNYIEEVWRALGDGTRHVVVQTAPAVRVALAEAFGAEAGERVTGRMVAALRRLGFDRVFDTNFSADLTIIEESHELLARLAEGATPPMITPCSPGGVKVVAHEYPDILPPL